VAIAGFRPFFLTLPLPLSQIPHCRIMAAAEAAIFSSFTSHDALPQGRLFRAQGDPNGHQVISAYCFLETLASLPVKSLRILLRRELARCFNPASLSLHSGKIRPSRLNNVAPFRYYSLTSHRGGKPLLWKNVGVLPFLVSSLTLVVPRVLIEARA